MKNKHGRKPMPEELKMKIYTVRMRPELLAKVRAAGAVKVRKLLEEWNP